LGLEAQRDASGSHEQQQKLERLISAISQPDWLKVSSNKHKLPKEGHREVTDTAIQDIGLRLIKKIQAGEFDPQKGKISHFVKNSISFRQKDAAKKYQGKSSFVRQGKKNYIKFVSSDTFFPDSQFDDTDKSGSLFDVYQSLETSLLLSQQIIDCIKEDPDKIFRQKHMRKRPKANFRAIALLRVYGYNWQEIAEYLGTQLKATARFHDRCLQEFAPTIREYLQS
jgi:hypothetical protein